MADNGSKYEKDDRKSRSAAGADTSSKEAAQQARPSEGQPLPKQATPSPDNEKLGAGPAMAEHSKDAKAPKGGRKPAAYVKR